MCFNKEISLSTFILALGISFLFIIRNRPNDILIGIFNLTIASMQLVEYFIWSNMNNDEKNKFYTRIAKLTYILHPLIILIGFYYFGTLNINNKLLIYPIIFSIIYTYYLIVKLFKSPYNVSTIGKINKHLSWNGNIKTNNNNIYTYIHYIYYATIIILFPLLIKPFKHGLFLSSLILFTAILSYMKTNNEQNINDKSSWKSLWCNIGNLCAVIYYIFSTFNNPKI
tara:strand:- start:85 stop:762 length:678 start_codon:yes stop_codon:yes gene_type:complete